LKGSERGLGWVDERDELAIGAVSVALVTETNEYAPRDSKLFRYYGLPYLEGMRTLYHIWIGTCLPKDPLPSPYRPCEKNVHPISHNISATPLVHAPSFSTSTSASHIFHVTVSPVSLATCLNSPYLITLSCLMHHTMFSHLNSSLCHALCPPLLYFLPSLTCMCTYWFSPVLNPYILSSLLNTLSAWSPLFPST